jgi:fatty-acid desaturase
MDPSTTSFIKRDGINWTSVTAFAVFHVGAVVALFFFSWPAFFTALALYWISLSLGIGMGYHRLLTHRSYKTPKWIEYFLAICGTLALEGGPMFWVATHRVHHQFSDKDGDPHTPRDGKWWSHIVWMLVGDATHCNIEQCSRYAPDICKDRFLVWLSKYHYVPLVTLGILLLAFGGLPFFLWGIFFRVTMGLHATWMVNSLTHFWGSRRFTTRDGSRNNWFVALMSFGEGWHNNHHAHPTSARHGLAWYEIDISWWEIRLLQAIGLAKSVHCASLPRSGRLAQSLGKVKNTVDKLNAVTAPDEFPVMPLREASPVRALLDCPIAAP